jgi:hypothetical protein
VSYTIILHLLSADPIMGETDELPGPNDTMILVKNPRKMDGKDLHYIADNVTTVYWPVERLNFIEILGESENEEIIGYVRE